MSVPSAPPPAGRRAVNPARRVLFVHAHPDDEVIATGISIAAYAAAPDTRVTLVTCTLGELGEVLVPELAHLRSDLGDQLGGYRIAELERACAALGLTDQRFLGGAGRFRDSGMMGTPGNDDPRCLWQADLTEATVELVRVVRAVRPQVLVSYDANGAYGHPDHIRAHQITVAAFTAAADPGFAPAAGPPWAPSKLYETATPKSFIQAGIEHFANDENSPFPGVADADEVPMGVPDELITTRIEAPEFLGVKMAAMRAHRTQIAVDGFFFALADGVGQAAFGTDHYVLTRGTAAPATEGPNAGYETDLFAGLEL
ncbi:N-acetyl-1-D-myo-inositol-2-amino-2-deoxy-alpha-D-glucopyranoside deacetylase [Frankia sp. CNm7]|uniref:1D-myo-inositol 2-acetamido-2-deoxy-alpha-D-glucopyranoside deacetylase n=1 Tax=Frankia nepalensis TaxID=1836974 RepID=A0A937RKT5_9ACTN|nr:N-acetyl-1-D-myo-inositol-2-amino-2-deoxy-alpha-D-glucopyranoside deacetylase [Frankia nepalensis]MBL7501399.1 N-acetyl-1-D-myo-inositol-2-amino-2-deoxy-alpha-D-glucopyranoside deacetylase [Frankia nepalensis]MBL7511926.1 N-acetyl-1-D-myo-inositol-2-amino-2-deoxy-alpha-D-glucopyranoside deacetylase [Frankia nepalensis]MBL7523433.1 N-acetyl-1-D-myo-inositol-2-amino-2-deoxy-alpha-D-glucopyranoside deacetylase [Frankia nepalensis]MBL7628253.1 N-acetyl-1-D-myo-inositol-2-amino-2-deoxy-alpha-D-gl